MLRLSCRCIAPSFSSSIVTSSSTISIASVPWHCCASLTYTAQKRRLSLLLLTKGGAIDAAAANTAAAAAAVNGAAELAATSLPVTATSEEKARALKEAIAAEDDDILSVYPPEDSVDLGIETPQWVVLDDDDDDDEVDDNDEAYANEDEKDISSRTEGGRGKGSRPPPLPLSDRTAFVIIDPFSPFLGRYIKKQAQARNLVCIDVLSSYTVASLRNGPRKWRAPRPGHEGKWANLLPPFKNVAFVLSESDHGVATAERMHAAVGAPGNGVNPTRRNKWMTNEALRERGVGHTKQILTGNWEEAEAFIQAHLLPSLPPSSPLAVVKPNRGAASGDVHVCLSLTEVKDAFDVIKDAPKYGGGVNKEVLIQEYLMGEEYAVDTVSATGTHKVTALWKYDKRAVNGAPCVYFATILQGAGEEEEETEGRRVCDYVLKEVLPALGVEWGPTHTEVIMKKASDGSTIPVIVECNTRWHLCNFLPLTDACLGHNSVDLTLDAFISSLPPSPSLLPPPVSSPSFASLPSFPSSLRAHGRVVHLVCFQQGEVVRQDKVVFDLLQSLPSVRELVIYEEWKEGGRARKTVDIRSDMGYALLWHEEKDVVEKDYQTLLGLQGKLLVIKEEEGGEEGEE
ncbi:Hypothetical protein NocV09_02100420 [Nannochloropsis oceanica]